MTYLTQSTEELQREIIAGLANNGFTYHPLTETFPQFLARALGQPTAYLRKSSGQMLAELHAASGGSGASHLRMHYGQLLGVLSAQLSSGSVPSNTVAPVVSGSAIVGSTLTSTTGTWSSSDTPTYAYQWKSNGSNVGSNQNTYVLVTGDVDHTITCTVTATNSSGSGSATSAATAAVEPLPTYLPTVSASPSFVIGTSKLIAAYAGPAARVQRISDDAESDLSFGSKFMDVSGLSIGSHAFKTLYDQTGNGNHPTQATKANQPSASNVKFNGCPAFHFDSSDLAVNTIAKYMGTSSGPVTEKSAFTMFLLICPTHSFNDNYYVCQPDTATTLSLYTQSTNVGMKGNNSTSYSSTRRMPRAQPCVLRWRGGSTGKQFAVNGSTELISTAPTAGTVTGIAFGHHSTTATYDGKFDLMACVIYNATLSDADCLSVETALYAQCTARSSATNLVIFDGDSRTQGAGRTLNETWIKKLIGASSKAMFPVNMGVGGQTMQTMAANVATRVTALYNAIYTKNIVVVGGAGINDFTANRTAAQVQTDLQTYATALNASQILIVATVPLRDTSTTAQNNERVAFNTWLRANYASLKTGTTLVDLDAIPEFATWSSTYWIDIVHFKDAGQALWQAAFQPAIEAIAA